MADEIKGLEGNVAIDTVNEIGGFLIRRGNIIMGSLCKKATPADVISLRHVTNDMLASVVFEGNFVIADNSESSKMLADLLMEKDGEKRLGLLKEFNNQDNINKLSEYQVKRRYLPERGFETLLTCDMYSDKASQRNRAEWQRAYVDTISTK